MAYGNDWESDGWHYKHIAAGTLIEFLQKLPEGSTICCNDVRNLAVCDDKGLQFGHITIGSEELVLYAGAESEV